MPTIEVMMAKYGENVRVYTVNIDQADDLASLLEIERVPTLLLYKGDTIVERIDGFIEKQDLDAIIRRYIL
jgi:thioredoxin 1